MYLWHIIVDCKNHLYLKTGCEKKFADLSARQVDIVDSKYIQVGQDEYKYKYLVSGRKMKMKTRPKRQTPP